MSRLPLVLMKAGWQATRRIGASHVLVDAFVDDVQRAHAVYEKLGFEPLGETYSDARYVLTNPSLVMAIECQSGEEALPARLKTFFRSQDPTIDHGI